MTPFRFVASALRAQLPDAFDPEKAGAGMSRHDTLLVAVALVAHLEDVEPAAVMRTALARHLGPKLGCKLRADEWTGETPLHRYLLRLENALDPFYELVVAESQRIKAKREKSEAAAAAAAEKAAKQALHYNSPRIAPARRHRLFDPAALPPDPKPDKPDKRSSSNNSEDPRDRWRRQLRESSSAREHVIVDDGLRARVDALRASAPNLGEALDVVSRELALCQRAGGRLALSPLLLVGPPAAGKTWLAAELASALNPTARAEVISMPGCSAAFELAGGAPTWSNAQPGRIVRTYLRSRTASPVFILDEIEKASHGNYPPGPVLLGLLEREDAKRWRDEFFDLTFDVSPAVFFATANTVRGIDSALLSRFRVVHVDAPTAAQRPAIIRSLYTQLRREYAALDLPADLDADTLRSITTRFQDARQVQRLLRDALGEAARRPGPLALTAFDTARAG